MRAHEQHLVHDLDAPWRVRLARTPDEQHAAVALLDRAESIAGVPLVDERERLRLERVAHHADDRDDHWHPLLCWAQGPDPVGYAGVVLPPVGHAVGDVVPANAGEHGPVAALLRATTVLASAHDADDLTMWLRRATSEAEAHLSRDGWTIDRRLLVLSLSLETARPARALPEGVALTAYQSGADVAIAALLNRAYAGTDDADWDQAEVGRRRALPWFDPAGLLLAWRGDDLVGLHWTKRRDDDTGEVYNLAVDPAEHGKGLGSALLDAGLARFAAQQCRDVVLWVDAANDAGRRLYDSRGFVQRWQDLAWVTSLVRHLGDPP